MDFGWLTEGGTETKSESKYQHQHGKLQGDMQACTEMVGSAVETILIYLMA